MFKYLAILTLFVFTASQTSGAIPLRNWGLENFEADSHINIKKAWNITRGNKAIVVAVIDTGIDPTHPDLKDNLWHKNGTDEYGWDFVEKKKNPMDEYGHGTHIAGIIGATAKSGAGVSGVAPNVSIMALRCLDPKDDKASVNYCVQAINYAVENGAQIINFSAGGTDFSAAEKKAIEAAGKKGILFVTAAGNHAQNLDSAGKFYPASYGLDNIISVAATTIRNELQAMSNWGLHNVNVAAPGEKIFSTFPHNRFSYLSGTSQAAAFVTGVATLMLSENETLSPKQVREILIDSSDRIPNLVGKIQAGGHIDAYAAVKRVRNTQRNIASKPRI